VWEKRVIRAKAKQQSSKAAKQQSSKASEPQNKVSQMTSNSNN